jgi:hypothetical protein
MISTSTSVILICRRVIFTCPSVTTTPKSETYTRTVRFPRREGFPHAKVWKHAWVWFLHWKFDFYTKRMILTRTNVLLTRTSVIFTHMSVILTRCALINFIMYLQCIQCVYKNLSQTVLRTAFRFNTQTRRFNTHKCSFKTHACSKSIFLIWLIYFHHNQFNIVGHCIRRRLSKPKKTRKPEIKINKTFISHHSSCKLT